MNLLLFFVIWLELVAGFGIGMLAGIWIARQ